MFMRIIVNGKKVLDCAIHEWTLIVAVSFYSLGVEDGLIEDFQISASDYYSSSTVASPPHRARLNAVTSNGKPIGFKCNYQLIRIRFKAYPGRYIPQHRKYSMIFHFRRHWGVCLARTAGKRSKRLHCRRSPGGAWNPPNRAAGKPTWWLVAERDSSSNRVSGRRRSVGRCENEKRVSCQRWRRGRRSSSIRPRRHRAPQLQHTSHRKSRANLPNQSQRWTAQSATRDLWKAPW